MPAANLVASKLALLLPKMTTREKEAAIAIGIDERGDMDRAEISALFRSLHSCLPQREKWHGLLRIKTGEWPFSSLQF